jgi:hypothetical protein
MSDEDAARRCWKYFPYYHLGLAQRGQSPPHFSGVNAELPLLIKDRVSRVAIAGIITKDTGENHETMNAAIRHLLQRGAGRLP